MTVENNLLIKSIELLASTSDGQRRYLKQIGTFPSADELALEFDDAYRPFISQAEADFQNLIMIGLSKIDSLLNLYSDMKDKTIWSEEALDNIYWTEVRDTAISVLKELNVQR